MGQPKKPRFSCRRKSAVFLIEAAASAALIIGQGNATPPIGKERYRPLEEPRRLAEDAPHRKLTPKTLYTGSLLQRRSAQEAYSEDVSHRKLTPKKIRSKSLLSGKSQLTNQTGQMLQRIEHALLDLVLLGLAVFAEIAVVSADGDPLRAVDAVQVAHDRLELRQRADSDSSRRGARDEHRLAFELGRAEIIKRVFERTGEGAVVLRRAEDEAVGFLRRLDQLLHIVFEVLHRLGRSEDRKLELLRNFGLIRGIQRQRKLVEIDERHLDVLLNQLLLHIPKQQRTGRIDPVSSGDNGNIHGSLHPSGSHRLEAFFFIILDPPSFSSYFFT
ncbi:hypothetical protein BN871_EL_00120 [Paenibacillus sp. P22]|nr:hypothetical protein BN871_EL_00120 [Paenibacillus sp. P22]